MMTQRFNIFNAALVQQFVDVYECTDLYSTSVEE